MIYLLNVFPLHFVPFSFYCYTKFSISAKRKNVIADISTFGWVFSTVYKVGLTGRNTFTFSLKFMEDYLV